MKIKKAESCDVYSPDFPAAPASADGPRSAAGRGLAEGLGSAAGRGPAGVSGSEGDPGSARAPGGVGGCGSREGSFLWAERLLEAGDEEVEKEEDI